MLSLVRSQPVRLRILFKAARSLWRRDFAGRSLSNYERFILLGGDEIIWNLRPKAKVLVLGGYKGESTLRYAESSKLVVSLEPVDEFRMIMESRVATMQNVMCLKVAAGSEDGSLELNLRDDETSPVRAVGSDSIEVPMRDIASVVDQYGPFELMECNIEGGEYSVIPRLCESGAASKVEKILVQFHDVGPNTERLREEANKLLAKTHMRVWSFDFVWELWVRVRGKTA